MSEVTGGRKTDKIPSPIVGNSAFGLTEQDVTATIKELAESIAGFTEAERAGEKMMFSDSLPQRQKELEIFTSSSPAEIVAKSKAVYDRVGELERAGSTKEDVVAQVRTEFPDIMDYYWLLRKTMGPNSGWGYLLGQAIRAAKLREEEESMYGKKN